MDDSTLEELVNTLKENLTEKRYILISGMKSLEVA